MATALQDEHDPLRAFLEAAPADDEPLTEEDRIAIEEARAEKARGEVVPHSEVERQFRG